MDRTLGDPYENFANAIIVRACEDYKVALRQVKNNPQNLDAVHEMMSIETFLRSKWFCILTRVEGEFLIEKLRAELEEEC